MKKMRFTIRIKLALMTVITITIAATTLGIFLSNSFSSSAYKAATNELDNVSTNATLALKNSVSSAETSMNLLVNQIGYNYDFANNITSVSTSVTAEEKVKTAMAGKNAIGDGSTIIGAMDYLIVSDSDIESATMYSPYVTKPILSRLMPVTESEIKYEEVRYQQLLDNPGESMWFFTDDNRLFVWKAIVNFGVDESDDMQVVGYIEYGFNRASFLTCLTDTQYQNNGMYLFDENNTLVLSMSSGLEKVDNTVKDKYASLKLGIKRYGSYTASKSEIDEKGWTYISFINHRSIEKTNHRNTNITIIIVLSSVFVAALVAYLLAAREIKRIKNLSKAASSISGGDYKVRIKHVANDEITDVSDSFNVMAERVQDSLQELILQQDSISENFATILSNKSGESGNHVKRVSEYSAILAQEMGFNESEVHDIRIASMLHDVGKIMVDESILHKPGRFTDEEYIIMQQHVAYGGKLLEGVPGNIMQLGAIIALYHHERWDGNGYVHHLKGDEIPKEAQITSVADVFDALVSKRCYKGAWTIEEAYNEIVSQSGKQFSPAAVEAFQKRFEDFKHISELYKDE